MFLKCSTRKKAKKNGLDQLGLEYQDVHIVEETPSEDVILDWLETSGLKNKHFSILWDQIHELEEN